MAKLYIVGTPIGNLQDMTFRAVETLKSVDVIACEDTRHSLGLLNYYDIKKKLVACHKFNEKQSIDKIASFLNDGQDVAIITDAGMPAISDPGAVLVDGIRELGFEIAVIPGPTALTSAIALSGILEPVFTFIGFLPTKNKDKEAKVLPFKNVKTALVFYSSPYDINKDIQFLFKSLGDRKIYIVKEITKIHESVEIGMLSSAHVAEPKGEYVLVVNSPSEIVEEKPLGSIVEQVENLMFSGLNKKDAIKEVAKNNSINKNEVYQQVMHITESRLNESTD